MALQDIVDQYQRHKIGTNWVIEWLVTTASQHRDLSDTLPTLHAARNAIRQAKKKKSGVEYSDCEVQVSTQALVKLASIIAHSAKEIPQDIITVARDVIRGRKSVLSGTPLPKAHLWQTMKATNTSSTSFNK
jgi:hypothetical protein